MSDLVSLCKKIVSEKKTLYPSVNVNIVETQSPIHIKGDNALEIGRIVSNILQNSIEACEQKNCIINLSLYVESSLISIAIQDNGKGISAENLEDVFIRGVSINKQFGTGLGLAHAKEYIESIGGSIHISSKVGKGTLVTIRIPAA